MHLHDNTIAHIAKLVQLAMITGTDIIDHLRMMKLSDGGDDGLIRIDKEYELNHNGSINDLVKKVNEKGDVNER
jgi:hypothetical protein